MRPGDACGVQMLIIKTEKGERKPNLKAAGSKIMRLQFTVNFKTGPRRHSTR